MPAQPLNLAIGANLGMNEAAGGPIVIPAQMGYVSGILLIVLWGQVCKQPADQVSDLQRISGPDAG